MAFVLGEAGSRGKKDYPLPSMTHSLLCGLVHGRGLAKFHVHPLGRQLQHERKRLPALRHKRE